MPGPDTAFQRCRLITDDVARLRCYVDAAPASAVSGPRTDSDAAGAWRLVRTPNPAGGPDAVSIMHTADASRSDLDLAGLLIRCGDTATEVLVVLIRPFPPRARPEVTIKTSAASIKFTASVVPPGALLLLPSKAAALAAGPWQAAPELTVAVKDEEGINRGVIPLTGLGPALQMLWANCPPQ